MLAIDDVTERAHDRETTRVIDVDPGTVVVYSDIGCPWAHAAVYRLHEARRRQGAEDLVRFDMRPFPLELHNSQSTPKLILDAEIPVVGAIAPEAGWQMWQPSDHEYPGTMLPALEAVEAAKEQGLRASEQLDRALRVAFFGRSRNISMRHVIAEVARGCSEVDETKLLEALDDGRARAALMELARRSQQGAVAGSPHVFLPDGTEVHNPGVEMHWEGEHGEGFPVVDRDEPEVYDDIIRRAAGA